MVGSKSSAGGVTSQRSSRSLAVDVSTVSDAPVEPNKLIRRRPALGDVSNRNSKGGGDKSNPGDEGGKGPSLRRSRRLSGAVLVDPNRSQKGELRRSHKGQGDTEANVSAPIPNTAYSRRPPSRTHAKITSSIHHACNESTKHPPGAGSQETFRATSIANEEDLDHPKPSRKRGRPSTCTESPGDGANGPSTKKQNTRKSRGRRSSLSDILMEDTFEPDEVNCPRSDVQGALTTSGDSLEETSKDDHCLARRIGGPFDASKFSTGVSLFDIDCLSEVEHVSDYVTDIFQRLFDAEEPSRPAPDYMERQVELNGMMRSILVDWLVEVHTKFRLQQETLYLCINIIDRYLSRRIIGRGHLQLVGVTALLLACKYEEIYPPEVKDCVYITDRAYTRQNVLDMEADIVNILMFKMSVPTGYPFLERFLHVTKASRSVQDLSNFYMEKMLQEYGMLNYRSSLVAATVVCLALSHPDVIESEDHMPGVLTALLKYTGFKVSEIKDVAVHVCEKVGYRDGTTSSVPSRPLHAVARKYQSERYSRASIAFRLPSPDFLNSLQA